jgi:UDP-N-acetylglucosamine transferase subunit ALG13
MTRKFKNIFVTIGTTEFSSLIEKISDPEVYKLLKDDLGCEELKIQFGRGEKLNFDHFDGIKVEVFDLKDSIADDIDAADLVRTLSECRE